MTRPLGAGGMGSVWIAEHLTLHSPVALKVINPIIEADPQAVERFLREARTAAHLRSPHVVQILDYGVDGDTPYIAMEILEGESLADRLERLRRLTFPATTRVIRHVARAIGRAHDAGVVHRDLKPENIFIVSNDDAELIKVLDFGIVKTNPTDVDLASSPTTTRTGVLIGTPYFMSPEQAEGAKTVDHKADIWALGVLAFQCLLGELPFRGDSIGRLILSICSHPLPVPSKFGPVPGGFDAWFAKACARDLAERFESAKQAADEFEQLDGALPTASSSRGVALSPSFVPGESLPGESLPPDTTTAQLSSAGARSLAAPGRLSSRWARTALFAAALAAAVAVAALGAWQRRAPAPGTSARTVESPTQPTPHDEAPLAASPVEPRSAPGGGGAPASGAGAVTTDQLGAHHDTADGATTDHGAKAGAPSGASRATAPIAEAASVAAPPAEGTRAGNEATRAQSAKQRPARARAETRRRRKVATKKDAPPEHAEPAPAPAVDLGI